MKSASILFGGNHVEQIVDHETKLYLLEKIRSQTDTDIQTKTFRWLTFDLMWEVARAQSHAVALMTRGTGYWMYLTKIDGACYVVLIEKKIKPGYPFPKMLLVSYRFEDCLYNDTLFEAEFIRTDTDSWVMMITDLLVYRTDSTRTWTLVERFNRIHSIVASKYSANILEEPCALQVRRLFPMQNLTDIARAASTLPYAIKGLMFYPLAPSFPSGHCTRVLWEDKDGTLTKEVPPPFSRPRLRLRTEENRLVEHLRRISPSLFVSLNLFLKKTAENDVFHIYVKERSLSKDPPLYYDLAHLPTEEIDQEIREALRDRDIVLCECRFYEQCMKWGAERVLDETEENPTFLDALCMSSRNR